MCPSRAKASALQASPIDPKVLSTRGSGVLVRVEHRALTLLRAVTSAQTRFLADGDAESAFQRLLDSLAEATGASGAILGRPDDESPSQLQLLATSGMTEELLADARPHILRAWRENTSISVDRSPGEGSASAAFPLLAVPYREGNRALGVLCVSGFLPQHAAGMVEDLMALGATLATITVAARQLGGDRTFDVDQMTQLLANVSHEIRTPLNAVLGAAELLWESELSSSQREHLALCRRAGTNLLALVDDLVDLSWVEAGRMTLDHVPFEVGDQVARAVDAVAEEARRKNIEIVTRVSPLVGNRVSGDPSRLRQVMVNLLRNAIKFTQKGTVRLEVDEKSPDDAPGTLLFSVHDTGIGIAAENLEKIFDRFSQVDPSTTRAHGGTGLGLAICRQLVTLMEGQIWAESELGVGTTMRFTARFDGAGDGPVRSGRPPSPPSGDDPDDPTASTLDILLVEDHPDNRMIVTAYLKDVPHRMTIAESGESAVAAFKAGSFHIVLMDMQMPIMDGYEATRRIRAFEREQQRAATPIVALTAHVLREEIERARLAGCDAHLGKPISKAALLAALEQHALPSAGAVDDVLANVDPDLLDLIPGYIQNRFRDVATCRGHLELHRFEEVRVLAHGMAGSGGAYGFDEITRIGRAMEGAARSRDALTCTSLLGELEVYVQRIHEACGQ